MVAALPLSNKSESGFTIVEVLVAFTILAMTLAIAMDLFGSGLRFASAAREHGKAVVFAESLLQSVGKDIPLKPGTVSGTTSGLPWEVAISPATGWPGSGVLRPYAIAVKVQWKPDRSFINIDTVRLAHETEPQ